MAVYSEIIEIAATGVPQPLSVTRKPCDWVLFHNGGLNVMAIGGPNVAIADDTPLEPGEQESWPPIGNGLSYDLQHIFVVGTAGDVLRVKRYVK
jgi:hypothetical protein